MEPDTAQIFLYCFAICM